MRNVFSILACSAAWYLIGCPGLYLLSEVLKYFLGLMLGTQAPSIVALYNRMQASITDPWWLLLGGVTCAAALAHFAKTRRAPEKPARAISFPIILCAGIGLLSFHYRLLALLTLIPAVVITVRYVFGRIGSRPVVGAWLLLACLAFLPVDMSLLNMDGPPHFANGETLTDVGNPFARWIWVW